MFTGMQSCVEGGTLSLLVPRFLSPTPPPPEPTSVPSSFLSFRLPGVFWFRLITQSIFPSFIWRVSFRSVLL